MNVKLRIKMNRVLMKQLVFNIYLIICFFGSIQSQDERYYIKIVAIVAYDTYLYHSQNITRCKQLIREAVNGANYLTKALNLSIALVDTIVWTSSDQDFTHDNIGSPSDELIAYKSYANLNESIVLFTRKTFVGENNNIVSGTSYAGAVCSRSKAVISVTVLHETIDAWSSILAHEIGHSVGIRHDYNCQCPFVQCIMSPYALGGINIMTIGWSVCSLADFNSFKNQPYASCMLIPPDENAPSYCGDGIVEAAEECDCGPRSVGCQCCHAQTCTLASNAVCGSGPCCNLTTCNYIEASSRTVCRKAAHQACDFVEYCDGQSRFCPEDKTIHDGIRCAIDGFCYKGKCGSPDAHCSLHFKTPLRKSDLPCFDMNSHGEFIGPCGFDGTSLTGILCDYKDIECGRISCLSNGSFLLPDFVDFIIYGIFGYYNECAIIDAFDVVPNDFGLTPNGALCGFDYLGICINTKCIPVHQIVNDNSCPGNCNGHGICNNFGQCHCSPGYNQPDCSNSIT